MQLNLVTCERSSYHEVKAELPKYGSPTALHLCQMTFTGGLRDICF